MMILSRSTLKSVGSRLLAGIAVAMTLSACSSENTVLDPNPSVDPPNADVFMTDQIYDVEPVTDYDVEAVRINKETGQLELDVLFSGGCADHDFALYVSSHIRESLPPQTDAYLVHHGNGDACDGLVYETVSFDLSPIHDQILGTGNNDVGIYLYVFDDETRTETKRLLYGAR